MNMLIMTFRFFTSVSVTFNEVSRATEIWVALSMSKSENNNHPVSSFYYKKNGD